MSSIYLSTKQLSERWGVSEGTLERWRVEGLGPLYLKLQGRVLYRIEDIEAFEGSCLRKSTSEQASAGGVA